MLPPAKGTAASTHLDMLRGLSAVLVAVGHVRLMLILDARDLPHLAWYIKPFYFITNLGSSAVMVFFVLSGFFIGSSVLQEMRRGKWQWNRYAIARISRIYTVLIPALILGIVLDLGGTHFLHSAAAYSTPRYGAMLPESIPGNITYPIILGNLFCLQEIFVPTMGSNHPLWSLTNEVWYYALFPLLVGLIMPAPALRRCAYAILLLGIFWMLTPPIRTLFSVWLMGAAITFVPRTNVRCWHTIGIALLFAACLMIGSMKLVNINAYVLGALTSLLVYCFVTQPPHAVPALYEWLAARMSSISYTFYLTHTPFVVFLAALIIRQGPKMHPDAAGIIMTFAVFLAACAYATLIWFLFEKRTGNVRIWLQGLYGKTLKE